MSKEWSVANVLMNDYNQIVSLIVKKKNNCFGFFGIGSVLNDMKTISALPASYMREIILQVLACQEFSKEYREDEL